MKLRHPVLVSILMVFFFSFPAVAENYTAVTDEVDVDYGESIVRVYAVVKSTGNYYDEGKKLGRKLLLSYIGTLTIGGEQKSLEQEFKKRPALWAKVQHIVEDKFFKSGESRLPASEQYGYYFTFDLKLLKPLIPELNMPQPAGAVQ